MKFSIYLSTGEKVYAGPDGKPYDSRKHAESDASSRNERAREMGLTTKYVVGGGFTQTVKA